MEKGSRIQEDAQRFGSEFVVLIPAYEPGEELPVLIRALSERFERIVLVNDGSTRGLDYIEKSRHLLEKILVHDKNRGKGAAIKTGLDYIGAANVITVDADGQHAIEDVVRIAETMSMNVDGLVLGVRTFSKDVPFRSRFGNWWTRFWFFLFTRMWIKDTQTGLRGIPKDLIARVRALDGERYEYEMVMLAASRDFPSRPIQIPIRTIYLNDNSASHFSPLKDTISIYGALFRYLWK